MFWTKKQKEIMTPEEKEMTNEALKDKITELDLKIKQAACEHEFKPKMVRFYWGTIAGKECIHCELQKRTTELEYKKLAYDIAKKELNEYYAGANVAYEVKKDTLPNSAVMKYQVVKRV